MTDMPTVPDHLLARFPGAEPCVFGDGPALSAELTALVRSGAKTATCSAVRDYAPHEPLPQEGRCDVVFDWAGTPVMVLRATEVIRCTYETVTEEMALAEGEDDSLESWRAGHRAFFERGGGFAPDMEIVWMRFEVVEVLDAG